MEILEQKQWTDGQDITGCFESIGYPLLETLVLHGCCLRADTFGLISKSCPNLSNIEIHGKWADNETVNYSFLKNIFPNLIRFRTYHGNNIMIDDDDGGDFDLNYDFEFDDTYEFDDSDF